MDPHPDYDDADISTQPLAEIQPIFSRGLWRNPVKFVSAGAIDPLPPTEPIGPKPLSIADRYLAIVFPNGVPKFPSRLPEPTAAPVYTPPPSNIDRTRFGLKYLEKHGFDVDSGKGLGPAGDGMLYPIKVVEKRDNHGLGLQIEKRRAAEKAKETLDAGKMRTKNAEDKKKAAKLQQMFYGDDKVQDYLEELDNHEAKYQPKLQAKPGATRSTGLDLGAFRVSKPKHKRR